MRNRSDFLRYAVNVFRRGVDATNSFRDEVKERYESGPGYEVDKNNNFVPMDLDHSTFEKTLDILTSPSFGVLLSVAGAATAFATPVGPLAASVALVSAMFFGAMDVYYRNEEIKRVENYKRKRAAIDTLVKQNAEMEILLEGISPKLLKNDKVLDRLKLGAASKQSVDRYSDKKFQRNKIVKGVLISEFPCAAYSIGINVVALNPIGLGMSVSAAILGTTGSVMGQVKHEEQINEMYNYIAKNGMIHLGISSDVANKSKFIEELNAIRSNQIAILKLIKENPKSESLTPKKFLELYNKVSKAAEFGAVKEEESSIFEEMTSVFFKGFDRRQIRDDLNAKRPDFNVDYRNKVSILKPTNMEALDKLIESELKEMTKAKESQKTKDLSKSKKHTSGLNKKLNKEKDEAARMA